MVKLNKQIQDLDDFLKMIKERDLELYNRFFKMKNTKDA